MDIGGGLSTSVVKEFIDYRFSVVDIENKSKVDELFFTELVEGVVKNQEILDKCLSDNLSKRWPLYLIDSTVRAILRSACFEIQFRPDVPALVIIDQYVSISSDFFAGKEIGFINGTLDSIAKDVRKAEFGLVGE
jgi:N utilization substance protein B